MIRVRFCSRLSVDVDDFVLLLYCISFGRNDSLDKVLLRIFGIFKNYDVPLPGSLNIRIFLSVKGI